MRVSRGAGAGEGCVGREKRHTPKIDQHTPPIRAALGGTRPRVGVWGAPPPRPMARCAPPPRRPRSRFLSRRRRPRRVAAATATAAASRRVGGGCPAGGEYEGVAIRALFSSVARRPLSLSEAVSPCSLSRLREAGECRVPSSMTCSPETNPPLPADLAAAAAARLADLPVCCCRPFLFRSLARSPTNSSPSHISSSLLLVRPALA